MFVTGIIGIIQPSLTKGEKVYIAPKFYPSGKDECHFYGVCLPFYKVIEISTN